MTTPNERKAKDREVAQKQAEEGLARVPKPSDVASFKPSNAKSIAICPSWTPIESVDASDHANAAADGGTDLHKACEVVNIPEVITVDPKYTEEEANCIKTCLMYVRDVLSQYMETPRVYLENKLPFLVSKLTAKNGLIDRLHVYQHHADVFDYKFGFISVDDAEVNWQGWCYVLAVFRQFPELQEVTVHFPQPRTDEVSSHTFTRNHDEPRIQAAISEAYANSQKPAEQRSYNFNETNCKYCSRLPVCPAAIRAAQTVVANLDTSATKLELDPAKIVDASQYATLYAMANILITWGMSVKDHTKQFMLAGHSVPGLKIQERAGAAYIPPESVGMVVGDLSEKALSIEDILGCADLSITKLSEAYAKANPSLDLKKAKAELLAKLSELGAVKYQTSAFYPVKD